MRRTYVIAEAGVNHNGDINLAKEMIIRAKAAGADAVKFQTFKAQNLVAAYAPKAGYQKLNTDSNESQMDMLKKLELSFEEFTILNQFAAMEGIDFVSTPFDEESLEYLSTLDMPFWKIPSGEITNLPYLRKIASTGKPIIMSTGMSTIQEISHALEVFSHYDRSDITLLQCNTEYPTPYSDVNLQAMTTMKCQFGVKVGYSDHTPGFEVSIAAVALGAVVIEKHFTLDKNMDGPDHKASLEPRELADMVTQIRNVELAIGIPEKKPSTSEMGNKVIARKSIVARTDIKEGDLLTEFNLSTKRPGDGISPFEWDSVVGTKANRNYIKDEKIDR